MATKKTGATAEAEIGQLVEMWTEALRAKDVDGLMANYAPDMVLFDLAPPLQYKGADAYRKNWEQWLRTVEGPIGCERHELDITNRITAKRTDGTDTDVWVRVPFYMDGSLKAAVHLRP